MSKEDFLIKKTNIQIHQAKLFIVKNQIIRPSKMNQGMV